MLPSPSIRKFLRESFSGGTPVFISAAAEQRQWLIPVQKHLDGLNRVTCKFHVVHRLKLSEQLNQLEIVITPSSATDNWRNNERFRLHFSEETALPNALVFSDDGWRKRPLEMASVSSVDEIEAFIEKIKSRQDRNFLRERKSTKITNLKESGMKARLRQLGAEHDFGFAIGQNARNVNLSLQVAGKKTGFHFSFPKGKFDAMIEQLPDLIANFENMANLGITFRTNNRKWGQPEWIFPDGEEE